MAIPPPPLPAWMLNLSQQEQQPIRGYAEMDQYQNGGQPSTGSYGDRILNNYQGFNSIDPQGYSVQGSAPTLGDRIPRAMVGAFKGYDTGNKAGNIGLDAASALPVVGQAIGVGNAVAGGIQGYRSNALDFNRMTPGSSQGAPSTSTSENYAPSHGMVTGATRQALLDIMGGGSVGRQTESAGGGLTPPGMGTPAPSAMQAPGAAPAQGQFTGGSGRPVSPYALPAEHDLEAILSNAQRYGGYDASTGRIGAAGNGISGYANAGFDFAQDAGNRDVGKSAKYAFSYLADQASRQGAPMPMDKAGAEQWFSQYIKPGLESFGYPVEWVKGDKARIKTREGWDEIDYLGNAGGSDPMLTWQSELLAGGGNTPTAPMGGGGMAPASGDMNSSALFEQLMKEARRIAEGQPGGASVADTNALLQMMGS